MDRWAATVRDAATRDRHDAWAARRGNWNGRPRTAWRKMPPRTGAQGPSRCPRSNHTGPATDYVRPGILRFFGKTRATVP